MGTQIQIGTRWVRPLALSQVAVYADVLEGLPERAINARIVAAAVETAERMHGLTPALIPPVERSISRDPLKVALPSVRCIARVRSDAPAHDPNAERSEACLVWFQDEFAFPLDSGVAAAMLSLDWTQFAKDDFM